MILALRRLRRDCTAAKEALSFDVEAQIPLSLARSTGVLRFTRPEFEALIRPAILETIDATRRAIRLADSEPKDLSAILMVGGSSRIPLVTELLGAQFRCPLRVDAHPKDLVAMGAARAAQTGVIDVIPTTSAASFTSKAQPLDEASEQRNDVDPGTAHAPGTPPNPPADVSRDRRPPTGRRRSSLLALAIGASAVVALLVVTVALSKGWGTGTTGPEQSTEPSADAVTDGSVASEQVSSTADSSVAVVLPGGPPLAPQELVAPLVVDGRTDLFRVNTDTGVVTARLTETAAADRSPVISPARRSSCTGWCPPTDEGFM